MSYWPADELPALGPIKVVITHVFIGASSDLDNLAKPVLDALKGLAYVDDGQVTDIVLRKRDLTRDLRLETMSPLLLKCAGPRGGVPARSYRRGEGSGGSRLMQTSERFAEARQVQEVAREYRSRGYDVVVEPEPGQLPEALSRFRPDFVARKADEVVVVEVKSRGSLTDP